MRWSARMGSWGGALAALVAVGCSGSASVSGEIGGDQPDIRSGYFAQEDGFYEGGDGIMYVRLTSLPDPCDVDTAFNEAAEDADDAADLENIWQDNFPEDFWLIDLVLRVGDPGDSQKGAVLDGVAWDAYAEKDDQAYGVVTHFVDLLDEEYWTAALGGAPVDVEDYGEVWVTDGGDLEITGHHPDETLKGRFPTEVAQPEDGDTDGEIEIAFSLDRCVEMERYLFE